VYCFSWLIEKKEDIDLSSFRSVELILILICFALVWVCLNIIIGKYDKDNSALEKTREEKTRKEKILDMILLYWLLLVFIVPILCYSLGVRGWEFVLVEFVCYIMLNIMGRIYNRLGLGSESESQVDVE
jgi:ABC-type Fe3+ transport system permease subunit